MKDPILRLQGISKSFAGIHAVRNVDLEVGGGRILGLIGQNGAGKSTLMNIIGGVVRPNAGMMAIDGAPYAPRDAGDAVAAHIAFIHQELNLFGNLTVAENIFLGDLPSRRIGPVELIDRARLASRTRELLGEVSLDIPPETPLDRLSPGERQLVEIAKAIRLDARIIIFDEPTTSLTHRETERLFRLIGRLRERGTAMIYISHVLADVMRLADDIAVLRDGEKVASGPVGDFDIPKAITMMVGRPIDGLYPQRQHQPRDRVLLAARQLTAAGIVRNISFELHAGEVLGLFGLMGSGRTELARILFGLDPHDSGGIDVDGEALARIGVRQSIRNGMAFVTENRRTEGLLMDGSVAANMALVSLRDFAVRPVGLIEDGRLDAAVAGLASALGIKAASLDLPVRNLSGGNQQKVVLAKWLMSEPSIFILDEPTRGIDVGAKFDIYTIIEHLAAAGGGILFISSDLDELLAVSDRILVLSRGEVVAAFPRAELDRERILAAAFREKGAAA
ncbi:MAG TPA: sugar ABC transporter ATP-binding protein [Bauldia sp.]|nr:sugar ABC transporter ATP-binding protein [Bauldia sp.]